MWMGVSCSFLGALEDFPPTATVSSNFARLATVQAHILNEKNAGNHSGYIVWSHHFVSLFYCRVILLVLFGRASVQNKSSSRLQSLASTKDVVAMIWSSYSWWWLLGLRKWLPPTNLPFDTYFILKQNLRPERLLVMEVICVSSVCCWGALGNTNLCTDAIMQYLGWWQTVGSQIYANSELHTAHTSVLWGLLKIIKSRHLENTDSWGIHSLSNILYGKPRLN